MTSKSELEYIEQGVEQNIRGDGRKRHEFRAVTVETAVLPQCNGSCRVTVGFAVDLICSVKLEVTEPDPSRPTEGLLEVSTELSPSLNLKADKRKLQDEGISLSNLIKGVILDSAGINLSALCIIPGKFCWTIHIDILVLQSDGNILDPATWAAYMALSLARYPRTELIDGETGTAEDFELSGDLADSLGLPLNPAGLPILFTVAMIGPSVVLDCTSDELKCSSAAFLLAFDKGGRCCTLRKHCGAVALAPGDIIAVVEVGKRAAAEIIAQLETILSKNSEELKLHSFHPEVVMRTVGLLA